MHQISKAHRLLFAFLFALGSAAACSSSEPPPPSEGESAQATRGLEMVGVWRFVYDEARRRDVEAKLAAEISDPEQLARAKQEAEEEAAASEIEFTAEGWFLSRIAGKEIERAPYTSERVDHDTVRLTTLRDGLPRSTEVVLAGAGVGRTISIFDPKKGPLTFVQR